jgi:ABC-type cobalamin/Fe3+-siderophores transport system ATPase subunit
VVLKEGGVYACGTLKTVLTSEMVREVYGVEARILQDDGIFQVVPVRPLEST